MIFNFDARLSDSPFVDVIWRTQSDCGGTFTSIAESHWGIVVTKQYDNIWLTVRGPETKASAAPVPENAEFFGIVFKLGTSMLPLPARNLVNGELNLPEASSKSFWLHGSAWQFPNFDNADTFINRLVHGGLIVHEPVVDAALQGHLPDLSLRSVQRRFVQATGLSHNAIHQIERARRAVSFLENGLSILDTVDQLGYADQPHLTRSLKHLMGQTPAQIVSRSKAST